MFENNKDFYPTTKDLAKKMFDKLTYEEQMGLRNLLEPSGGAGHLIEYFKQFYKDKFHRRFSDYNKDNVEDYLKIDTIEKDEELFNLLRGKGLNVIDRDFLTHEPQKFYGLIFANFPYSDGVKHMLKAISIQERMGGRVICLLNKESITNPYSNDRKHLVGLLEKYNADIEYIDNAFSGNDAERKTDVSVALISVDIPMSDTCTMFERQFKRDNPDLQFDSFQALIPEMNKLDSLIFEYDLIKNSAIELFKEKHRIDLMLNGMNLKAKLVIADDSYKANALTIGTFIENLNKSYWDKFINETNFKERLPSKLRETFTYNMEKQSDITFNIENVKYFYEELTKSIPQSYEKTCSKVFDDLTWKNYYSENEWCKNIWGYSGWKSNSCYKIQNKSIIRANNGYYSYSLPDTLTDLIIIFENISGIKDTLSKTVDGVKEYNRILEAIKRYEKNIDTEFFLLDSYKKQTLHIKYKNKDYLNQFNIMASKGKNWLPPDFGSKNYSDMSDEEKILVKEFGMSVKEYSKLTNKIDYLMLTC